MERRCDEPAFPRDHRYEGHNGMTLRDYFAAHAVIPDTLDTSPEDASEFMGVPEPADGDAHAEVALAASLSARFRYIYADAMLAARGAE